jgi:hypothetical protein
MVVDLLYACYASSSSINKLKQQTCAASEVASVYVDS